MSSSSFFRFLSILPLLPALAASTACSSSEDKDGEGPGTQPEDEPPVLVPGINDTEDGLFFVTDEFSLEPSQERFLCYATTLEEDVVVNGYDQVGQGFVHHVVFSRAMAPEPDGLSECDVLFRPTWEPLYVAGTGDVQIKFPDDLGQKLKAGEQLVVQLHLLNSSTEPVTDSFKVEMRRSTADEPRPIATYAFGNMQVRLPPSQPSTVEAHCNVREEVQLIAAFPHMHYLGKKLTFEVGRAEDQMQTVFTREPYDFDNQYLEPFELSLSPGDFAKTTCYYENPYDQEITFGESTLNEMCFLIGFAADREELSGCIGGPGDVGDPVPNDPEAGMCGDHTPTAEGVGLPCTAGGTECPANMDCTANYRDDGGEGVCFSTGCSASADCGGEFTTCCSPPQAGGAINICIPEACRQPSCVPVD